MRQKQCKHETKDTETEKVRGRERVIERKRESVRDRREAGSGRLPSGDQGAGIAALDDDVGADVTVNASVLALTEVVVELSLAMVEVALLVMALLVMT